MIILIRTIAKVKYQFHILLLSFTCLLSGCKHSSPTIEYGKSFDEIAGISASVNKNFCIILSDPECSPCEIFLNALFEDISVSTEKKQSLISWMYLFLKINGISSLLPRQ